MSKETSQWLNQNVLVGMTSQRGNAWHYKKSDQGDEPNHYENEIPVEDVKRRLFAWQAELATVEYSVNGSSFEVPSKRVIYRNDTNAALGVASDKYALHQYDEWLVDNVANILDDSLVIGSAGLLRGGSVAWVQVEMPESMKVADVEFRPNLLATTSFDSSIPTTYKRTVTVVVCDNTREMAMRENGQDFRVRHTANSALRIVEAREALSVIHQMGDEFAREVELLLATTVTDAQFDKFLSSLFPVTDDTSKHGQTRSESMRDAFTTMWASDPRVAPWRGTAYGVVQLVNTHRQHERPTRGGTVAVERTMLEALSGHTGKQDAKAMQMLSAVLN